MAFTEASFSVDDFQDPKMYKNAEAISVLLTRLLLLEPGTIQSHPDMGVGLYSKYAYSVMGEGSNLQADFERQIQEYLPAFQGVKITVKEKPGMFIIGAEIDGVLYGIYYDKEKSDVSVKYTNLSDL